MSGETLAKFTYLMKRCERMTDIGDSKLCLDYLRWIKAEYERLEKIVKEHDEKVLGNLEDPEGW